MSVSTDAMDLVLRQLGIDTTPLPNGRNHSYFAVPHDGSIVLARRARSGGDEVVQVIGEPRREYRDLGVNPLEAAAFARIVPLLRGTYGFEHVQYTLR